MMKFIPFAEYDVLKSAWMVQAKIPPNPPLLRGELDAASSPPFEKGGRGDFDSDRNFRTCYSVHFPILESISIIPQVSHQPGLHDPLQVCGKAAYSNSKCIR